MAEHGDTCAQRKLGEFYAKGLYASQDSSKAIYWFTKAAEQGNIMAQSTLGDSYYYGKGVAQDDLKAVLGTRKRLSMETLKRNMVCSYATRLGED